MQGWLRNVIIIIPYIIVVGVFQMIGFLVSGLNPNIINYQKTTEQHLILSIFTLLGTSLIIWFFTIYVDKEKLSVLGFKIKDKIKDIILGLTIGLVIMTFAYIVLTTISEIQFLNYNFDVKEIVLSILIYFIVSIVEEGLFRGYFLRNFMLSFNKYIALILSSVIFALAHGANPNINLLGITNLFLAGILLGISYIYTKNLWFPIALHFSWNLSQTFFGFNISGQDVYSLVEFKIQENNIINGGNFGFEGSILCIIIQIIVIISIYYYYKSKTISY